MSIVIRPIRVPDDYEGLAALLNSHWSEPISAQRLKEDDGKLFEVGDTYKDSNGLLAGYDRIRYVAISEEGRIVGYVWSWRLLLGIGERLLREGIRITTLAEAESIEDAERKIYEIYRETLVDIPGYNGDVPDIGEWRKWYLKVEGYDPELVLLAADGERFVGVSNLPYKAATKGIYHEYTGVSRAYRNRQIARALKVRSIQLAKQRGADYLKTDNDSMNAPMLAINRSLGYLPLRGTYRLKASLEAVKEALARLD